MKKLQQKLFIASAFLLMLGMTACNTNKGSGCGYWGQNDQDTQLRQNHEVVSVYKVQKRKKA